MRDIPASLAEALKTGATTHCRCWLLARKDGVSLGITDHDADLVIAGSMTGRNCAATSSTGRPRRSIF